MSCYACRRSSSPNFAVLPRSDGPTRSELGELLWPEKITRAQLEALKVSLGSYRYAGQYQQRPSPADGGIFKRSWFRYWRPAHMDLCPVTVRLPGPMNLRLIVQPTVEAILAIRAGPRVARQDRPPFLSTLLRNPSDRRELLRPGWKDVGKVFVLTRN